MTDPIGDFQVGQDHHCGRYNVSTHHTHQKGHSCLHRRPACGRESTFSVTFVVKSIAKGIIPDSVIFASRQHIHFGQVLSLESRHANLIMSKASRSATNPRKTRRQQLHEPDTTTGQDHAPKHLMKTLDKADIPGSGSDAPDALKLVLTPALWQDVDPTSGFSFLNRAHAIFFTRQHNASKFLSDKARAKKAFVSHFDRHEASYEMLEKSTTLGWLGTLLDNVGKNQPLTYRLGNARVASVLAVMAVAYLHSEIEETELEDFFGISVRLTDAEEYPSRIESAQARLTQLVYLLQTSRLHQA
jgi:hypothetical protein